MSNKDLKELADKFDQYHQLICKMAMRFEEHLIPWVDLGKVHLTRTGMEKVQRYINDHSNYAEVREQ